MSDDHAPGHGLELAILVALGVIAGLGMLLWVSTGLAAVLSGKQWPTMSAGAVGHALLALPSHFADPRLAWPPAVRAGMPGPVPFYLALVLVLAITAAAAGVFVCGRGFEVLSGGGEGKERPGARWGTGRDLAPLRHRTALRLPLNGRRPAENGRLGLGYRGRTLLRGEARHALVVFGPPQSGKSAGVAIPALLEWKGPAVASSIKTDLHTASARRRQALGEVMVFDPYGLAPVAGSTWSPLRLAETWDGALSTAMRISAAAELDTSNVKGGGYWSAAAEQRLAPLLYAAAKTGSGVPALVRWAYGQGDTQLPAILHQLIDTASDGRERADAHAAYDAHIAFEALAAETRSSIESTVQMLLRAYRSPRVQASARSSQITPDRLLRGSNTLYLIGDSHRSKLLRPIFLALLQELIDHAYHNATLRGGRLRQPLLLCLDELGNVAPLPNLAEVATTAPSHNIQLVSIFHDIAQAQSRYGDQAHTVINSHRARMLLPGVADLHTLRYFSDLLGEQHHSKRRDDHEKAIPERLPLAAPQQLRQLNDRHALLIYGRLPPAKLRLRSYYEDRALRSLAAADRDSHGR